MSMRELGDECVVASSEYPVQLQEATNQVKPQGVLGEQQATQDRNSKLTMFKADNNIPS